MKKKCERVRKRMLSQMNGWIDRLTQFIPAKAQKKIILIMKKEEEEEERARELCG